MRLSAKKDQQMGRWRSKFKDQSQNRVLSFFTPAMNKQFKKDANAARRRRDKKSSQEDS